MWKYEKKTSTAFKRLKYDLKTDAWLSKFSAPLKKIPSEFRCRPFQSSFKLWIFLRCFMKLFLSREIVCKFSFRSKDSLITMKVFFGLFFFLIQLMHLFALVFSFCFDYNEQGRPISSFIFTFIKRISVATRIKYH